MLCTWTGARLWLLWPDVALPGVRGASAHADVRPVHPSPVGSTMIAARYRRMTVAALPATASQRRPASGTARTFPVALAALPSPARSAPQAVVALAATEQTVAQSREDTPRTAPILPGLPAARDALPSRWSASAWLVARPGTGIASGPLGNQLGGSQAGVRVAYLLDRGRRIAVSGRLSTPLGAGLREAAVALEWQPLRLPVRVIVEHRVALGSGRGGPGAGVVGGFGPTPLARGWTLEGYGEAGVIHRATTEPYADGALRVAHPIATIGTVRLDLGAGTWGAAQTGASRVDVGPSLALHVPIAGHGARLSLDWRQRIAGDARPGSGPALTLGADF